MMTVKEFRAGIPFSMLETTDLQPVYYYAEVREQKSIYTYGPANPVPVYHCDVLEVNEQGIKVVGDTMGFIHHVFVLWYKMHRIGDGLPVHAYTWDCKEASIYAVEERTVESNCLTVSFTCKVVVKDLYSGVILKHLTKEGLPENIAHGYAKAIINYQQ